MSPKTEIRPNSKRAHRLNPSNSLPTTSVTGSREGKTLLSRASGVSTSQPAFLSTGSSLKEMKSTAFPPMQRGEWAINRIQNTALRKQHAIQIGPDGVAPWGYLPQELARPLDHSGFATLFQSWVTRRPDSGGSHSPLAGRFSGRLHLARRATGQCDGARCLAPWADFRRAATHDPSELRSAFPARMVVSAEVCRRSFCRPDFDSPVSPSRR